MPPERPGSVPTWAATAARVRSSSPRQACSITSLGCERLGSAPVASSAVLGNPANYHRAVPLTYEQFRYAFANAVSEEEARDLYDRYAVPASGAPLFQAAVANINPWSEVTVDTLTPDRGPLLIISGEKDHTVPWPIADASYKKQARNDHAVTEIHEMPHRGHALTIDHGWHEVAETALSFISRFVR